MKHPLYNFDPNREKSFFIRASSDSYGADVLKDALGRHAQACHGGEVKGDCQGCKSLQAKIEKAGVK